MSQKFANCVEFCAISYTKSGECVTAYVESDRLRKEKQTEED
ncbi:hypothetical protein BACOVA_04655 [Bacteroides ovatus ATCC 8483]|uniref:Uncharacterized protein n=1 Tax=Bacteroides ovatus (strain ATCC 8483 / DSM 1896 / JCM 5824 / BCRC 10623 / CCUG 4943 / NCTC 11153) TaxID=411476 RepID=A0AAN3A0L7_BACO1|nr:hypothetical protein BACOVA_04655 [Bacteroides ovatus ATCC 8483]